VTAARRRGARTTAEDRVVTVFGSSRPREHEPMYAEARALGRELAGRGLLVCTGGYSGVMEAVSRGAKEAGGKTLGVTAEFFRRGANAWVDEEVRVKTWQERLFELIRRGEGYVACRGGTGTLAELAVVWEMLNKAVMPSRPFVTLGNFWLPILERVREVETGHPSNWGEANRQLVHQAASPAEAAEYLARQLAPSQPNPPID
jgi:uncharacterized protein (TIGR00730 family)